MAVAGRTAWWRSLLALLLFATLAACQSRDERAAEAMARAQALFENGDYLRAREEARLALQARDDVSEHWLVLARSELALSQFASAFAAYQRVNELDRTNMEALTNLAELAFAGGALEEADEYADQLLAFNTSDIRALIVKGSVALRQEKLDEAAGFADQALALDPSGDGAMILRARVLSARDEDAAAVALLEQRVAARGDTVPMLATLLEIYRKTKNGRGLEATYGRLFRLNPQSVDLQIDYARELYLNGKTKQAFAVVDRLQRAKPNDAALQGRIVDLWLEVGGSAIPVSEIRRMAARGSPAMRVALARYALEDGHPAEALRLLQPFVKGEIGPETLEPHVLYAMTLHALGRSNEALARATRVLAFDETNPRALLLRTQIAVARGDFDRALTDAQVLARDNPKMASTRAVLGQIYALRGENDLAEGAFERSLQDLPDSTEVLASYINFLTNSGQRPKALRTANDFTKRNPESIEGWKQRADLCLTVGDQACAEESLAALRTLRGSDRAQRELALLFAARAREAATLSGDVRGMANEISAGRADLAATARQLIAAGRVADADRLVRFIARREPGNAAAAVVLANVMVARGEEQAAEKQLRATVAKFPNEPRGYSDLAGLIFKRGDRAGAYAVMAQGLRRLKANRILLNDLAAMQVLGGQPQRAIATYRTLLRVDPNDLVAVNSLASLLTDFGKRPAALEEAGRLVARLSSVSLPIFFDTRGWLALQSGRPAEAVQLLRRAVKGGGQPVFRYHLAEALAASGDRAGARDEARRAIETADSGDRWVGRARALLARI